MTIDNDTVAIGAGSVEERREREVLLVQQPSVCLCEDVDIPGRAQVRDGDATSQIVGIARQDLPPLLWPGKGPSFVQDMTYKEK